MAKLEYRDLRRETLLFERADNAIHFTKSSFVIAQNDGINLGIFAADSRVVIDGHIAASYQALVSAADDTSVIVGKTGRLDAQRAIVIKGDDAAVVNRGMIEGSYQGVAFEGDGAQVRNDGVVTATYAISVSDGSATVTNSSHGRIEGYAVGIFCNSGEGKDISIANHGMIVVSSGQNAISCFDETDSIISDGRILGDISLGGGNDVVDLRGGTLQGAVRGGLGDDRLITDSARHQLIENPNEGYDSVLSSVSYTIGDHVEQLTLSGRLAADGTGNFIANRLIGNRASNTLTGLAGNDVIDGRGGDDLLVGGEDRDIFVFGKNHGDDRIKDFDGGHDRLDLNAWLPTNDFNEIMSHIRDENGSAIIRFDHQSVTLVDFHKQGLTEADFLLLV